jgi:hypothetical protein
MYTVGILDFIFDDHKNGGGLLHVIELKTNDHSYTEPMNTRFILLTQ